MRTLKYFGIQAEKLMAFVILIGIAYGVVFGTMLSDGGRDCIGMVINYMIVMGIITIVVVQSSLVQSNMPLVLSMGGQRKEVFWGAQWTTALLIVQIEILYLLLKLFLPQSYIEYMGFMGRILPCICIAGGALSELLALLTLKFGRKGVLAGTVSISLAGTFTFITISSGEDIFFTISDYFDVLLFLFAVILYVVLGVIYYYQWKKYELRAF